jgi:kumamolisin
MTFVRSNIRLPRAGVDRSFSSVEVAKAYNYPTGVTGKGYTCGIVELGGGFGRADLTAYFGGIGLPVPSVTSVPVAGGKNKSDGPDGADGEVLLDIEVAASVAPGASFRVYFAPNTDAGFLAAIKQACQECDVVSISWGGPESSWDAATMDDYDAVFAQARAAGVTVFAAAGDSGADDGTRSAVVDFPASSPNVVGCGGTKLDVNSDGSRASEVTWDENDRTSATGGGVSKHFAGRQVPDVAGNADPATGYEVVVDGESYVIGGTSAVAPLYAGLVLLLSEALGRRAGKVADFLSTVMAHPEVCYDVTVGDNGAYRAGPGRDETTGFGVVDGAKLLAAIGGAGTTPPPVTTPPSSADQADETLAAAFKEWLAAKAIS